MRAHDILGERLSVLLRTVKNEKNPDYALLRQLSHGLIDELKSVGDAPSPQDALEVLQQIFAAIGVEIFIKGKLPDNEPQAHAIADIAREAVTNAVRHSFATQVYIDMEDTADACMLKITDNGLPVAGTIKEGEGLRGMRKKIEPFSGVFRVEFHPRFVLTALLPRLVVR